MSRSFGWDYPPGVTGNEWQITGVCPYCKREDCNAEDGEECEGYFEVEPPEPEPEELGYRRTARRG